MTSIRLLSSTRAERIAQLSKMIEQLNAQAGPRAAVYDRELKRYRSELDDLLTLERYVACN